MQNNVFWGEVLHKIIQTVDHCCGTSSEMMPGAVTPLTNSVFASAVDLACMVSKKIDWYSQRVNVRISNHTKIEIIFSKCCINGIFTIFLFPVFEVISRLFNPAGVFFTQDVSVQFCGNQSYKYPRKFLLSSFGHLFINLMVHSIRGLDCPVIFGLF